MKIAIKRRTNNCKDNNTTVNSQTEITHSQKNCGLPSKIMEVINTNLKQIKARSVVREICLLTADHMTIRY